MRSGEYVGKIATFEHKFSHCILIKKGELLETVRAAAEKMLGKNHRLNFFGRNDSACTAFYSDTVMNEKKQKCVNVMNHGVGELVEVARLSEMKGCFSVILKAGKIVKKHGKDYTWKLTITECNLDPIPKNYEPNFGKIVSKPEFMFF